MFVFIIHSAWYVVVFLFLLHLACCCKLENQKTVLTNIRSNQMESRLPRSAAGAAICRLVVKVVDTDRSMREREPQNGR